MRVVIEADSQFKKMLEEIAIAIKAKITFEENEMSVTIGGRIFNLIGRLPIAGETIEDKYCTYKILEVGSNRIKRILCEKIVEE